MMRAARLSLHTDPCSTCGKSATCSHCRCPGYSSCTHSPGHACSNAASGARACRECQGSKKTELVGARKLALGADFDPESLDFADYVILQTDTRVLDRLSHRLSGPTIFTRASIVPEKIVRAFETSLMADCRWNYSEWIDRCAHLNMVQLAHDVRLIADKGEFFLLAVFDIIIQQPARHRNHHIVLRMIIDELVRISSPAEIIDTLRRYCDASASEYYHK